MREAVARHRGRGRDQGGESQSNWGEQVRAVWARLPEAGRATIMERAQSFLLLLDAQQLAQLRERLRRIAAARAL